MSDFKLMISDFHPYIENFTRECVTICIGKMLLKQHQGDLERRHLTEVKLNIMAAEAEVERMCGMLIGMGFRSDVVDFYKSINNLD